MRLRISSPRSGSLILAMLIVGASVLMGRAAPSEIGVLSLTEDGRKVEFLADRPVKLSPRPSSVDINFGLLPKQGKQAAEPVRIRYQLEGVDTQWREPATGANFMRVSIGFLDQNGNEVIHKDFEASGQSPGWTGSFETSPLQHRREQVVVPQEASRIWVVITSAGAPDVVGAYFVGNLTIRTHNTTNGPAGDLLTMGDNLSDQVLEAWRRDGLRASMAKVVRIGGAKPRQGLAIVDDNVRAHAQWNTLKGQGPKVNPFDRLVVEWDEMFSISLATPATVSYKDLKPGFYRFSMEQLSLMGVPMGDEVVLRFEVVVPFWRTPWFWVSIGLLLAGLVFGGWRYRESRTLQMENARLSQQQVVEAERFRIARDIHDDLGAGVTQISLFSSEAQKKPGLSPETVADFDTVSQMSRNLVRGLYETVWAINPENDHLDSLATYICQMANQMCAPAGLKCRLRIPDLPHEVSVTASVRHNLAMTVKEALHNVIKHADATEVQISIEFEDRLLAIEVKDNGKGFDASARPRGHGLSNMDQRMKALGGAWTRVSQPGSGTRIRLELHLQDNGDSAHRGKVHT